MPRPRKFTPFQEDEMRRRRETGATYAEILEDFPCSTSTLRRILSGDDEVIPASAPPKPAKRSRKSAVKSGSPGVPQDVQLHPPEGFAPPPVPGRAWTVDTDARTAELLCAGGVVRLEPDGDRWTLSISKPGKEFSLSIGHPDEAAQIARDFEAGIDRGES